MGEIWSARLYVSRLQNQSEWWVLLNHSPTKWRARPHAKVCVSTLLFRWMQRKHCPPHIAFPLVYGWKKKEKDWRIKMLTSSNSDNLYSNDLEMTCIHCATEPLLTIYRATLSNYFTCCFTNLMNAFSHLRCTWSENIPTFTGRNDNISLSLINGWILWQKKDSCGRCTSEASQGLWADGLFLLSFNWET